LQTFLILLLTNKIQGRILIGAKDLTCEPAADQFKLDNGSLNSTSIKKQGKKSNRLQ